MQFNESTKQKLFEDREVTAKVNLHNYTIFLHIEVQSFNLIIWSEIS